MQEQGLFGTAGPAAELEPLLEKLKKEEVFVRELDTLGIAYHSPGLRAYVDELTAGAALGFRVFRVPHSFLVV